MPITDRLLLGPGPSNPYPEVMAALARPVLGHLDPEFLAILDETMARLRTVFRTDNALTLPMSGTGSAGMEACFVNLVEPGDTVIVGVNGVFGERMCEVARRCGAEVVRVDEPWGRAIDPQRLLDAQREHPDARAARGRARGDVDRRRERRRAARRAAATPTRCCSSTRSRRSAASRSRSTGGASTPSTRARRSASACRPASSPVTFSDARGRARSASRATPAAVVVPRPRPHRRLRRQRAPRYHHTAPISMIVRAARRARRAARRRARSGVGAPRAGRRAAPGRAARARLPARSPRSDRLPQLTSVWLPDGVDDAKLRERAARPLTTSRSAAGSASSRARAGASASWATRRASARSPRCSAPCASSSRLGADGVGRRRFGGRRAACSR